MDWTDQGIVLSARRHGESSVILTVLTETHGRYSGVVRGGQSRRNRGVLEQGNLVSAVWRARLEEHLGNFTIELLTAHAARLLDRADRLAALNTVCRMLDVCLAEREAHPALFAATVAAIEALDHDDWAAHLVVWEIGLLGELGFGLDLYCCAVTGTTDDLAYVSPRSGRAVSRSAAEPWRDRLLALPSFLTGNGKAGLGDIIDGLTLSGYFLERHVYQPQGLRLPDSRERLLEGMRRKFREGPAKLDD
ncbi:MAG: DNA repair protein RecO [Proteobacteria bacterium]|nr:DNA repair protein RecO [Pseudomonadota bacterium]